MTTVFLFLMNFWVTEAHLDGSSAGLDWGLFCGYSQRVERAEVRKMVLLTWHRGDGWSFLCV